MQEQIVRLKTREKLLEDRRQKRFKEAKAAEVRSALIQRVLAHSGPCQKKADVVHLIRRQRRAGASDNRLKAILKDGVRFQKTVVDRKGTLKLASTLEQLQQSLEQHSTSHETPLPEDVIVAAAAVPDEEPADVDAHSDRNNLDSDSDGATG